MSACVRACSSRKGKEKYIQNFDGGNLKEGDNLQYLGVDGG